MSTSRRTFLKQMAIGSVPLLVVPGLASSKSLFRDEYVVAETAYGKIRGMSNGGVTMFKGVPYAGKISGERRFLTPAKLEPWSGVKDALRLGNPSIQPPNQTYGIDEPDPAEDCLFLNIWTPANDGKKRPVMFYNHGGGFRTGSGGSAGQDGANLARMFDVVVVETNHRLGLLGFLYLDEIAPAEYLGSANRGVQDISIALEWVHKNIAEFGGDPDNVMIFGESGGGMKTSCLYCMPEAAPYFNKASIESGPGVIMTEKDVAAQTTVLVLKELGISKKNWQKLLEVSASVILETQFKVEAQSQRSLTGGGFMGIGAMGVGSFGPVVDGEILTHHPFSPEATKLSKHKPLLVGWNEDEQIFFSMFGGDTDAFNLNESRLLERISQGRGDDKAKKLIDAYKAEMPGASPTDIFIAINSIAIMGLGSIYIAEQKAKQGGAPAYLYNFGYKSEVKVPGTDYAFGAMHALDIAFKFNNVEGQGMQGARPEKFNAANTMSGLWASFARNGVPDLSGTPTWPAFDLNKRSLMRIDTECEVIQNRFAGVLPVWREIYNQP